jgi:adenine deaminase
MKRHGILVDIHTRETYSAEITIKSGIISHIQRTNNIEKAYIIPGLIDSHIHIESSMVTPGSFAMEAVSRGTTGVVSDPHEIANVLGIEGVKFMIEDALKVPMKFWFGAPSCVPATTHETSGAAINSAGIKELMGRSDIKYLSEMMNYPGVICRENEVMRKINIAIEEGKKVDGHAPGLTGEDLKKYISAGISTDHECSTLEEAKEKILLGMKILIREGSAAKNLEALKDLYRTNPQDVMLCSDDLHPEMLEKGHINRLIAKLVSEGYDLYDVVRSATINPVIHYGLEAGMLRIGDPADFIVIDDPVKMNVLETWIDGKKVFNNGKISFKYKPGESRNKFNCSAITKNEISTSANGKRIRVIEALDGELLTKEIIWKLPEKEFFEADPGSDILKIVVKDRYNDAPPAVGFIKGFGLKRGAFASSVAHDSHNIICIGTSDTEIVNAINEIVKMRGGLAVVLKGKSETLRLPVAGIMSDLPVSDIARKYESLSANVKSLGCIMSAPFMTLSFMALLVIPQLKISDKGLFDGRLFSPVPLFVDLA